MVGSAVFFQDFPPFCKQVRAGHARSLGPCVYPLLTLQCVTANLLSKWNADRPVYGIRKTLVLQTFDLNNMRFRFPVRWFMFFLLCFRRSLSRAPAASPSKVPTCTWAACPRRGLKLNWSLSSPRTGRSSLLGSSSTRWPVIIICVPSILAFGDSWAQANLWHSWGQFFCEVVTLSTSLLGIV